MKEQDPVKKIMEKYKYDVDLPDDVRKTMLKSKKKVLVKIFKKKGYFSIFLFFVLSLFFRLKTIGITITMAKSFVIVLIMSASIFTAVTVSSAYGIKVLIDNYYIEKKQKIQSDKLKNTLQPDNIPVKEKIVARKVHYKMVINPFEISNNNQMSKVFTSQVANEIKKIKGKQSVVVSKSAPEKFEAIMLMNGSITKISEAYNVSIRIIDINTEEILYYKSVKVKNSKEISIISRKIAEQVSKLL